MRVNNNSKIVDRGKSKKSPVNGSVRNFVGLVGKT